MAYFAIAFIAPNYRDYKNQWLKAYEPGTTTPKAMALDSAAAVTVAKLQLNADGFLKSAGDALVIPYIEGAYDLWLFPTSAEADANDTSSAIRVADDINSTNLSLINDLSQAYEFPTVAAMTASTIVFPSGKVLKTTEHTSGNSTGGATYTVTSGASPNTGSPSLTAGLYARLKLCPNNTIDMYGANSGQNSSTAINIALSEHVGRVKMESSGYILDAQLDVASGTCTGIKGNGEIDSVFVKAFNGHAIIINNQGSELSDFWVQGDGVSFTGGGVYIQKDDFNAVRFRCTDTADSPIITKADESTFANVENCFLQPTDSVNFYAVRNDGNDTITSPGARTFSEIKGGSSLVNFAGMNRATLTNSFGVRVGFDTNSDKIYMAGNRITNTIGNIDVAGNSHVLKGNHWGFGAGLNLIFQSTCSHVKYDNSNLLSINGAANSVCQNNAATGAVGTTNSIFQEVVDFTPTWKGSTTDATLGNSTVNSFYSISERQCTFSLDFIRGSTCVNPVGTWSWTMPFKASVTSSNSILVKSSSGTWYSATAFVGGASNQMYITLNASNGPMDETDLAFGTNAQIKGAVTFEMASS